MGRVRGLCAGVAICRAELLLGPGGTAGLDTVGGAIEQLGRSRDPAGVVLGIGAGVLKVAGALLALALVRPWDRAIPRRLLLGAAWAASAVLTAYGGLLVAVGGAGVDRAGQPRRSGRPDSAAVACPAVGPVVLGVGAAARRGCLALRSGIPQSGGAMNSRAWHPAAWLHGAAWRAASL
jgi:hypothetical protein